MRRALPGTTGRYSPQQSVMLNRLRQGPLHSLDARRELGIGDPSKRVCELRDFGFYITARTEKRGKVNGKTYTLRSEPDARLPRHPSSSPSDSRTHSRASSLDGDGHTAAGNLASGSRPASTSPLVAGAPSPGWAGGASEASEVREVKLADLERCCEIALEARPDASLEAAVLACPSEAVE